ncbi:MAG: proton-conducting transporter membrane subunit [Zavarzinia sp.]|nr:proton-conducting transporter membrane subunit [Zavarzinia sp.]
MTQHELMLAAVLLPFATALLIIICGRFPNLREAVTLVGAGGLALIVFKLISSFDATTATPLVLAEILPGFRVMLRAEPIGLVFAGVAAGLWGLNSLYSIGYMRAEHAPRQTRFYACFAVALGSAMAIALAGNLATLFVAYEALTFATYPLVVHWQTEGAIAGARRYLAYLLATSLVPFFGAIVWTWIATGTLDFTPGGILDGKMDDGLLAILLFMFAYGVGKAALMPMHGWLPAAMVAPTPVSALLHAVAVVKAGVFTLLKIAVYIFGIEVIGRGVGDLLVVVAAASVIAASLIAMTKDDLKARLAYSTVAQLAMVTLAVALGEPIAIAAGILQLVMHAWGKITLFFGAGAIQLATHKKKLSEIAGIGAKVPLLMIAFLFGSLSVAGLPPFGGMWPKFLLLEASVDRHMVVLTVCLGLSTLLTLGYLVPIFIQAFFRKPHDEDPHHLPEKDEHHHEEGSLPVLALIPPVVTAAGCVVLFIAAPAILGFVAPVIGLGVLP